VDPEHAKKALVAGLESLIAAEPEITQYDTAVGDGDCGIEMKRCAQGLVFFSFFASERLKCRCDAADIGSQPSLRPFWMANSWTMR
jgi:hypothetical protein